MTKRRTLRADDLPALAAFVRAYLHEDLIPEYGDAAGAAAAFARDAETSERLALIEELERLAKEARGWSAARLARFFDRELGAAWTPESASELEAIIERVRSRDWH